MAAIAYPQRCTDPIPTLELVPDRAASSASSSSASPSSASPSSASPSSAPPSSAPSWSGSSSLAGVYARRRLVAALVAVVALVLVAQLALAVLQQASPSTVQVGPRTGSGTVLVQEPSVFGASGADLPVGAVYVVRPGDTLWSIADAMAPGADVTATVERLTALNGSSAIQVGQRLHLD